MAIVDFVTLAESKAWLRITTSTDDTLITRLNAAASQAIRNELGYEPTTQTYTAELYNGHGGIALMPRQSPVTAVSALTIDGISVPAAASVTGSGYRFSASKISLNGYAFNRGQDNVSLSYTAGLAGGDPKLSVIVHACLVAVQAFYTSQDVDPNLAGESVPGVYSAQYAQGGAGKLPGPVLALLAPYKRRAPL